MKKNRNPFLSRNNHVLNNLAEFMKGLQEENQKLKDENKELKRSIQRYMKRETNIAAMCGNPDAVEACRLILSEVEYSTFDSEE